MSLRKFAKDNETAITEISTAIQEDSITAEAISNWVEKLSNNPQELGVVELRIAEEIIDIRDKTGESVKHIINNVVVGCIMLDQDVITTLEEARDLAGGIIKVA